MNYRQMRLSVPEGGEAVMAFPADPLSIETLSMLEECCALMFRGLKRAGMKNLAQDAADTEYASWSRNLLAHSQQPKGGEQP